MMTTTHATNSGAPCPECGYVVVVEGVHRTATCRQCQTPLALTQVIGEHNKAMPCDDRCQYAIGPRCSCSCGGDNHRRGYIHVEMVPAWVRKRDADRHAKKIAAAERRAAKTRQANADACAVQLAANPDLVELAGDDYIGATGFAGDMRSILLNQEPLTPRQLRAAVSHVRSVRIRAWMYAEREAARAAENAARQAAAAPCPTGRVTFTGTIVATSVADTHWGTQWRALVRADAGWQVWVTMPREWFRQNPASDYVETWEDRNSNHIRAHRLSFTDRRVQLNANITPALATPTEGTAKNPKGQLLDTEPAAVAA